MIDYEARRNRVQKSLREHSIGLLALGPTENMTYLLGFHPHPDERPCLLLLTPIACGFLMPELNAEESRQHTDLKMTTYADAEGPASALKRLSEQLGFAAAERVALDELMRTDFSLLLLQWMANAATSVASDVLSAFRMHKDEQELELIAHNAALADEAMKAAYNAICEGVTETQVADAVREAFRQGGVDQVNFAIIASGPNGAFPHHHTGPRPLAEGDAVILDIGARKDVYNSDITRMAFVGQPTHEYFAVHSVVEQAVQAALAVIKPGVRAREVDAAARDVISAAGYRGYFVHRTGHGLGLTGHEPPYITATNDFELQEGMVFSVEPGVYLPGKFGVRLEEIVAVTSSGVRVFSQLSRELFVVGR